MYKYVILDLDDTVLDFKKGEYEGINNIFKKYAPGINKDILLDTYKKINNKIWLDIERGANRHELLNTRFSLTLSEFDIEVSGELLEKEYRKHLDTNYYLLPGAFEFLNTLSSQNYVLIVGTNGVSTTQNNRLKGSNIKDFFNHIFISEEIGYSKPDKRFFETILDNVPGINQENSIMIGDRFTADIVGAQSVKMDCILFDPDNKKDIMENNDYFIANSYEDIVSILQK